MVRIMCVHGSGTNAGVFEAQTAAIRAALPSHWEFCFYNCGVECGPLPEIEGLYPGPYYVNFPAIPTVKSLQQTCGWLLDIIEEDGPFDGAMGMSAGGYNFLSMLFKRQKDEPLAPPLFHFLILLSGNVPYSANAEDGVEVTDWISFHRLPVADIDEIHTFNAWAQAHPEQKPNTKDPTGLNPIVWGIIGQYASDVYRREDYYTRVLHPAVFEDRLRMPTLHVMGSADKTFEGAKQMMRLCDEKLRLQYVHAGGHEVPRAPAETAKIASLIEKTVQASTNLA